MFTPLILITMLVKHIHLRRVIRVTSPTSDQGCVVFGDSNCLPGSLGFDGLRRARDPGSTTSDLYTSYTNSLRWNAAEDLLALPFSSGTTGQPKATMLSHLNFISMVNILRSIAEHRRMCFTFWLYETV